MDRVECHAMVRSIQNVLLELLQEIDQVCQKHGFTYYLYYGTLLGAIRHHGFIPWDDDADIIMPRHDYERFLEVARIELPARYFVQDYRSDPYYRNPFAEIRKEGTCCIVPEHRHIRMHQGIFVDIFPLDELPRSRIGKWAMWNVPHFFERLCAFSCARLPRKIRWMEPAQRLWQKVFTPAVFARLTNKACIWFAGRSGSVMSVLDPDHYDPAHNTLPKDSLSPPRRVMFEEVELNVPAKAEELLSHQYGEYMKLPPVEKRIPLHSQGTVVDVHRDYREYLPELYA
jgi:lipopolysaccharide cholinephosphotransferase